MSAASAALCATSAGSFQEMGGTSRFSAANAFTSAFSNAEQKLSYASLGEYRAVIMLISAAISLMESTFFNRQTTMSCASCSRPYFF